MSQKKIVITIAAMLLLACTAEMANTNTMGIAEKQTIDFTAPTLVGGTLLPAGEYNVTHQMNGQTHVMIFKQVHGKARSEDHLQPGSPEGEGGAYHAAVHGQRQQ